MPTCPAETLASKTHWQHVADTAAYNLFVRKSLGFQENFPKGIDNGHVAFALGPSSCLEGRCNPGSAAAVFPSSGQTQEEKDGSRKARSLRPLLSHHTDHELLTSRPVIIQGEGA